MAQQYLTGMIDRDMGRSLPTPAARSRGATVGITAAHVDAIGDAVAAALLKRDESIHALASAVHAIHQREADAVGMWEDSTASKRARAQRAVQRAEQVLAR
ncbi:hypothetical protein QTH90_00195 [Variovorax sp. J2P1-59]|uniref:hypothetical protein n=1 Tax=Variovorax flavidus TaxID=3053501 RepID=UPI002576A845|nr:hypothetical protein [Variovorax sp. J2P1-59]MDM0072784.1 hypothetical protein [Variovorax sp. J2P1-59]